MKIYRLLCLLLLCFLLVSCSENEPLVEYDGRLLTKEELKALVSATIETEQDPTVPVVRFGEGEVKGATRLLFHGRFGVAYKARLRVSV